MYEFYIVLSLLLRIYHNQNNANSV